MEPPGDAETETQQSAGGYYAGSSRSAADAAINCEEMKSREELTHTNSRIVLAMVGLPARGKSFISRKVECFFKWKCMKTKTFNVGKYRRDASGATESGRADFFDNSNEAAKKARQEAAESALDDVVNFLDNGGEVAIFDATNSTADRRQLIVDRSRAGGRKHRVIFLEVICTDREVVETNMLNKVKHSHFAGLTLEEALEDIKARIGKYEAVYETIEDDDLSYIKLYNMSSKVLVNRIYGSVAKSLMPYVMGLHIGTRKIWLARAGSVPAGKKKDAQLTVAGREYSAKLGHFIHRQALEHYGDEVPDKPVKVLASTATSSVQTVLATLESLNMCMLTFTQNPALNPIDRGRLDGPWWIDQCTDKPPFEELKSKDPEFYSRWLHNKLRARFPGGESYHDVMTRCEGVLLDIEMSTKPVLCVSHITLLQVMLCYFKGVALQDAWDEPFPANSVVEITPTLGGGFTVNTIDLSMEAGLEWEEDSFNSSTFPHSRRSFAGSSVPLDANEFRRPARARKTEWFSTT